MKWGRLSNLANSGSHGTFFALPTKNQLRDVKQGVRLLLTLHSIPVWVIQDKNLLLISCYLYQNLSSGLGAAGLTGTLKMTSHLTAVSVVEYVVSRAAATGYTNAITGLFSWIIDCRLHI